MKTANEIAIKIEKGVFIYKNMGTEQIEQLLKQWAQSIISKCADQTIDDATEHRILNLIDKL